MKKMFRDPSVRLNTIVVAVLAAGTPIAAPAFPWIVAVLWAVVAVTATVAVRRVFRHA